MSDTIIDWTRIAELRDEIGSDDFDEIVALFLSEAEESLVLLAGDHPPARMATAIHALKGSALNLGFHALSTLCAEAEAVAGTGAMPNVAAITTAWHASRQAFLSGRPAAAA
jgi:HPt (histidine-containing phosphotransfer) domain-containing protein